uniref:GPI-anchored protein LLG1-like n=1 Tax=Erigeron canadensis TaxID=72917 RepID=UPI001CB9A14E|nr:GPI-anchored protein LLG1-like [Erigeron canadensis]
MKKKIAISFLFLLFCCVIYSSTCCFSSPLSISDGVFSGSSDSPSSSFGRALLQENNQKLCPLDFVSMNYTIITSKCKAPEYPAEICCKAFRDFACPYWVYLNDLSTECAVIMFTSVRRYYPPGIFAESCQHSKTELECRPGERIDNIATDFNSSRNIRSPSILFITALTSVFIIFLFKLF